MQKPGRDHDPELTAQLLGNLGNTRDLCSPYPLQRVDEIEPRGGRRL